MSNIHFRETNGYTSYSSHSDSMVSANILEDFSHENNIAKRTSSEDLLQHGFRIGRLLGEGSYCKVRSAIYKGKEIAVKIITRDKLSVDFSSRFLPREIKALSQIKHKNIIHIFKIFNYPRRVYIFMELVERGDLLSYIKTRGKLSEKEARHYFRQMVSALKYLHSIEIAHRDLKCENIMINNRDEIKIIDFGFCRSAVNDKGRRELSQTYCGSTAYAAPEVLQGTPYNPMMYDVWSLGCVLFIMVTGTMPFDDSNVRKMVSYQLRRHIKYPVSSTVSECIKTGYWYHRLVTFFIPFLLPCCYCILLEIRSGNDFLAVRNSDIDLISRMLEPDVTRRATMDQISRCSWLRDEEKEEDFQPSTSSSTIMKIQDKEIKTSAKHKRAASKGTQTSNSFISSKFWTSDIWKRKKG